FNLYGIQGTTNPASPVLNVNGPIAREIGINGRGNLFGPGFRANATIGRAIRLIMTTIGGGVPQQADKSTLGNPAKYTCCFAENDADSCHSPEPRPGRLETFERSVDLQRSDRRAWLQCERHPQTVGARSSEVAMGEEIGAYARHLESRWVAVRTELDYAAKRT